MVKMEVSLPSTKFKWARPPPRVLVTADTASFDPTPMNALRSEGFQTSFLRYDGDRKVFGNKLVELAKSLELGEHWALVAYGRAATATLDVCMKPVNKLAALVTYYPGAFPRTTTNLPPNLVSVVHIAGDQKIGSPRYPHYNYPHARTGFAETNLDCFNPVASDLAWTRTLTVLRKGLGFDQDLETIWEKHVSAEYMQQDVDAIMGTMAENASVHCIPTLIGGVGTAELRRFYNDYFITKIPHSMKMRLISRTLGTDRIVDEMVMSFTHDQDFPWMLPGVKPTNKHIEIPVVMIVGIRGKKIYMLNAYWDQASVCVQAGLIDAKKLPVLGSEAARKLIDEQSSPANELLKPKKSKQTTKHASGRST